MAGCLKCITRSKEKQILVKINIVLPHQLTFPPTKGGGVEVLNWTLVKEFVRSGNEVVTYSRESHNDIVDSVHQTQLRHVRVKGYDLNKNRWLDHLNALSYFRRVLPQLQRADVTSFHTPFSFLSTGKRGIGACTHTIHRTPKINVICYSKLDRLYCGSDAVLSQALGIAPWLSQIKRIYNCVSIAEHIPKITLSVPNGVTFLYVGRFVRDKGVEVLIEAFASMMERFPKNRLWTIGPQSSETGGDTHFYTDMCRYVKEKQMDRLVTFYEPIFDRPALAARIQSADVICVPSLSGETFSMAVIEAMALAKPVLVSDFGPMPEAVEHQKTGYISQAGNSASLAAGMRFFSEHKNLITEIGNAAREKVRREFSAEAIAGQYLVDFEDIRKA